MSIASEIQALNTNLTSAKNAVTAKGGTVGDTGLAGLADEIASIPSGGEVPSTFGKVSHYVNGEKIEYTLASYADFLWLCDNNSNSRNLGGTTVLKGWIEEIEIADGVTSIPDGFCKSYFGSHLNKVILPDSIVFIGNDFLYNVTGNQRLNSQLNLKNVHYIGENFLYNQTYYNQPIIMPNILGINRYFLLYCSSFNSEVDLGDKCSYIGFSFMRELPAFAQTITIPQSVTEVGTYFLYNTKNVTSIVCNSSVSPTDNNSLSTTDTSAPMYDTGITLTGTHASDWKTALPDSTSSPYRKLILG